MANYIYHIKYNGVFIRNLRIDSNTQSAAAKRAKYFLKSLYPVKYNELECIFYALDCVEKKA
jgi:hypothetical protein